MNDDRALTSISVVVPTWRGRDRVARLLRALDAQEYPPECFEVVLAIDGSTDGTLELARAATHRFRVVPVWQENRGRASACNAGVGAARGDLIVILDDDMQPVPGMLRAHARAHLAHPGERVGVVGAVPVRIDPSSSSVTRYVAARFARHLDRLSRPGFEFRLRDFYSGNFSILRGTFLTVGGYDATFRIYGNEDVDLGQRLRDAGVQIRYSPDAIAWQSYDKDVHGFARDSISKGRTAVQLLSKHPEAARDSRLSQWDAPSRRWRAGRAVLLELTRLLPVTARALPSALRVLDRGPMRDRDWFLVYEFLADYGFWYGAWQALRERGEIGSSPRELSNWSRAMRG